MQRLRKLCIIALRSNLIGTQMLSALIYPSEMVGLVETEAVVLVFPTWWFGFPAVLKGWFDRVWGPGIAYDHAQDFGPIKPRLENLKKLMAITTQGAPGWVD